MSRKICKVCKEEFDTKDKDGRVKIQIRRKKRNPVMKNIWLCGEECLVEFCERIVENSKRTS